MDNSFKFVGGKLVQRSSEEQARLDRLRAAQAAQKPARRRTPRAQEPFIMLTVSQVEKLLPLNAACWRLFIVLLFESFKARSEPFELPTGQLSTMKGLSPKNVQLALARLEATGLILVDRRGPPLPPLISVPIRSILTQ